MRSNFIIALLLIFCCSCNETEVKSAKSNDPPSTDPIGLLQDSFQGKDIVVYANPEYQVMVAFERNLNGSNLNFISLTGDFPNIMIDSEGSKWNIFGQATEGPRKGESLQPINTTMGYFFSFGAFFPKVSTILFGPGQEIDQSGNDSNWTIDRNFIFTGASKDGIPSIDKPKFVSHTLGKSEVNYIEGQELVITYLVGDSVKVIPIKVLDYHEIVNDHDPFEASVISYCPLTGTSNVWSAEVNGQTTEFGVSGFLYNSNLVLYDRKSDTRWSQIKQEAINGPLISDQPVVKHFAEMTWTAAKELSKTILVLDQNTGFSRNYDFYPYGDYKTNNERFGSPLTYTDDRIPAKERVLSILIDGKSKVYRFSDFK